MIRENIIFFDGNCNLCNGSINFLLKIDCKKKFSYAPLSGMTAKEVGVNQSINEIDQSLIFYKNKNQIFKKSDAVIEIMYELFIIGKFFILLKLIPRSLRDPLYNLIAKNRYKFFGKSKTCRLITEEEKIRFLE